MEFKKGDRVKYTGSYKKHNTDYIGKIGTFIKYTTHYSDPGEKSAEIKWDGKTITNNHYAANINLIIQDWDN